MEKFDLEMGSNAMGCKQPVKKIEEYRAGYPQFTALIAANADFSIYRQFLRLRARVLLLKQDKPSLLEQKLDQLDQNENLPLFLGKSRSDRNLDRSSVLDDIAVHLADYDLLLEMTHKILSLSHALPRDVLSLQNWVNATSCLSRDETAYLDHERELISLASSNDGAAKQLEDWVEDLFVRRYKGFREISQHDWSSDPNVYLYSGSLIKRTAKAIMLIIIAFLLLSPVVICLVINSAWGRICVIITSTVVYLLVLSQLTKSRMIELILAGATFATILTVFVSV